MEDRLNDERVTVADMRTEELLEVAAQEESWVAMLESPGKPSGPNNVAAIERWKARAYACRAEHARRTGAGP